MKKIFRSPFARASSLLMALAALVVVPSVRAQQSTPPQPARATPPKIVLKLDDMIDLHPNWQKVLDMVNKRGIKAGFGIICNSLEKNDAKYLQWIKDTKAAGRIEFWCHGYDHKQWVENGMNFSEFQGPSYEQQKEHLQKCQQLAKDKLGFAFASLGTPFNTMDEKTAQVMRDDVPDFKVWMYGDKQFPVGKTVLVRYGDVNIENPIFHPSTERLAAGMAKHANAPYFVIQGHPPQWDAARLAEFEKMLDYLIEQKAVFVTPSELAASLPPPGPAGPLPPPTKLNPAPGATPAAAKSAAPAGKPVGDNLVTNGDFAAQMDGWRLDRLSGAKAEDKVEAVEGGKGNALHITVPEVAEKRYFVQLVGKNSFPMTEGKSYTLSFRANAKPEAKIVVVISAAQEVGRQDNIELKEGWADYSFPITAKHGAEAARLLISGLGAQAAEYWFTDISLKENQ